MRIGDRIVTNCQSKVSSGRMRSHLPNFVSMSGLREPLKNRLNSDRIVLIKAPHFGVS